MFRLLLGPFLAWARKLKYPALFKLVAALFVVSLVVPDPIPILDELLLALGTLMLAKWKDPKADDAPVADTDAAVDARRRDPIDGHARRG